MNPAFAYVYDDFLSDRRYERELSALEAELARRGIEGRVGRMALFKNAKEMIVDMVSSGVKNIVFVGDDTTLEKAMWFLPDMDTTVGFLPFMGSAKVGELLGIPQGLLAVDILAARRIETIDVGKLDDRYFLTEVVVPKTVAALDIEGRYRMSPSFGGAIAVRNLGSTIGREVVAADAKDGWLEAVIQTKRDSALKWLQGKEWEETRLKLKHGGIFSKEPIDVYVDGHAVNGFEFTLSIVPNKLKLITGRRNALHSGL